MIETWRNRRLISNVVISFLVGAFLLLLLAAVQRTGETTSAIRAQQKANQSILASTKQAAHDAANSARLIKSCVRPGGKCHQRGVKQTGEAVGQIGRVVVLSASCTAHIATATHGLEGISQTNLTRLITACVRSQLAVEAQRAP